MILPRTVLFVGRNSKGEQSHPYLIGDSIQHAALAVIGDGDDHDEYGKRKLPRRL